jgi:hypothetical protein
MYFGIVSAGTLAPPILIAPRSSFQKFRPGGHGPAAVDDRKRARFRVRHAAHGDRRPGSALAADHPFFLIAAGLPIDQNGVAGRKRRPRHFADSVERRARLDLIYGRFDRCRQGE